MKDLKLSDAAAYGIDNENFIVFGNNRLQAARRLGKTADLIFEEVRLPFRGFKTEQDVLEDADLLMMERMR